MTIDIWIVSIPALAQRQQELMAILNPEEQQRAKRFVTEALTAKYVAGHAALRFILAQTLGVTPESLEFRRGPRGKPYLAHHALHFNLSDAQEFAVVALSQFAEVGVDVDLVKPDVMSKGIHHTVLRAEELAILTALPAAEQPEAFFWAWTAKEALLKLLGVGLYKEMSDFAVPLSPLSHEVAIHLDGRPRYLQNFRVATGYIGSVASDLPEQSFRLLKFD